MRLNRLEDWAFAAIGQGRIERLLLAARIIRLGKSARQSLDTSVSGGKSGLHRAGYQLTAGCYKSQDES